jgi:hypothetical protein
LEQVRTFVRQRRKRMYAGAHARGRAAALQQAGLQLPKMDAALPAGGHGLAARADGALAERGENNLSRYNTTMDALMANGYLRARMVRVRLLHYFISRLVGALSIPLHTS